MTDQKYKLVPVEATAEMHAAMMEGYWTTPDEPDTSIERTWAAGLAAAPEPTCKWKSLAGNLGYEPECLPGDARILRFGDPFCPHCGKKIEES